MKRWLITALAIFALAGLTRLPSPAADVGKLEPVAAVQVTALPEGIRLRTDTGAEGSGADLAAAVADLHANADAYVFLDTADYLLLTDLSDAQLQQLFDVFRPSCRVCPAVPDTDLAAAVQYLSVHRPGQTLNDLRAGEPMR